MILGHGPVRDRAGSVREAAHRSGQEKRPGMDGKWHRWLGEM